MTAPTRWLPDRPLPPYTYVPGQAPHPVSDPRGHSFGKPSHLTKSPSAVGSWELDALLWGVDLFNYGFYWEAHEAWEPLWHAAGRRGAAADFFKGLIQLAVAGVKHYEGRDEGMRRHAARAVELLQPLGHTSQYGLEIADLTHLAQSIVTSGWPASRPVLRFRSLVTSVRLADSETLGRQ